ncbi:MAG: lipoyl synthase [Candidatus Neomarinimicrobiota bacterium]|nr:lipoyl synthase [Candidatus Neomarinimicrobiota bacterium]
MSEIIKKSFKPKIRLQITNGYKFVNDVVQSNKLNTVCEEARCPNIYDCWDRQTATIMILGDICTRACGFCSVKTGKPVYDDPMEPFRTAMAVKKMNLRHVVITSVDRDDLKNDYGASIWAETIRQIHNHVKNCTVEVLTPDFKGYEPSLEKVFNEKPEIFGHNVECVERISKQVRSQAKWSRSLDVLRLSAKNGLRTKTGMMVGLGESFDEVVKTMNQILDTGTTIFTIGQYLQPSKKHLPVIRYVKEQEFKDYKQIGLDLGFDVVESGPLVRSSYHADEQARIAMEIK